MDTQPDKDSIPPKPKRGWFQVHLSTSIALMIVAGLLIWAHIAHGRIFDQDFAAGWPFVFLIVGQQETVFNLHQAIFDGTIVVALLMLTFFIFEARHWGWSSGKIFVWAFIGAAIWQQIIYNLYNLFLSFDGTFNQY